MYLYSQKQTDELNLFGGLSPDFFDDTHDDHHGK